MKTFLRNALAALVVASAGVVATAPAATAGGVGFSFSIGGSGSDLMVRTHDRRNDRADRGRDRGQRWDRGQRGWDRGQRGWDRFERPRQEARGSCRPNKALRKARGMGLHRPAIVRAGRRGVIVEGFRRGRPIYVTFANQRNCPVIARNR